MNISRSVSRLYQALALSLIPALILVGCSGKTPRPDGLSEPARDEVAVGAERWTGGALLLPADTPVVLEARLDQVLDATRRLKNWVLAEPAMLGEDGEEATRAIQFGWSRIEAYFGVDPLDRTTWREGGVDIERPIFVAPFPIARAGQQAIFAVERQIRDEVGIPPRADVETGLRTLVATAGQLPEGSNSRVLRAVEPYQPLGGLRVVVPVTTSIDFLRTVASFAEGAGFQRYPDAVIADLGLSPMEAAYWSSGMVPGFAARAEKSHVVIDIVLPAILGGAGQGTDAKTTSTDLRTLITELPAGRPSAPRPTDMPSLGIGFDQARTADLVKLAGYRETLLQMQSARADSRDAVLLQGLLNANAESRTWATGARRMPGLAYALHLGGGESTSIGRATMMLFGRRGLPQLPQGARLPSLGIQERSAALGITLEPTQSDAWRSWFASDDGHGDLDAYDQPGASPLRRFLPGPRVLAMHVANLAQAGLDESTSPEIAAALEDLQGVRRLEIVGLTPDVTNLRFNPRFVVSAVLEPRDGDLATRAKAIRDDVAAAMLEILRGELPEADAAGLPEVSYKLETTNGVSYVVVAAGLTDAELGAELGAMAAQQSTAQIVSARLEPISFLSYLRLDDEDPLDPLDLDILAQRLGPLLLEMGPARAGTAEVFAIDLALQAPPRL